MGGGDFSLGKENYQWKMGMGTMWHGELGIVYGVSGQFMLFKRYKYQKI